MGKLHEFKKTKDGVEIFYMELGKLNCAFRHHSLQETLSRGYQDFPTHGL
jgi:hypothetical protein